MIEDLSENVFYLDIKEDLRSFMMEGLRIIHVEHEKDGLMFAEMAKEMLFVLSKDEIDRKGYRLLLSKYEISLISVDNCHFYELLSKRKLLQQGVFSVFNFPSRV